MTPSYERWKVTGYLRPVMDQLPDGTWWPDEDRMERVAVLTDHQGWTWEVVVEDGRIVAITVRPSAGRRLDSRVMKGTPLGYLRDAATSYWRAVDAGLQDIDGAVNVTPVDAAIGGVGAEGARQVGKPSLDDFAAAWKATEKNPVVGARVTTRREALRQQYRRPNGTAVSLATIDAWTREARARGLIDPPTTGRGNKTTGGERPSGNRRDK